MLQQINIGQDELKSLAALTGLDLPTGPIESTFDKAYTPPITTIADARLSFLPEVIHQAEKTLLTYQEVCKPSAHAFRFLIDHLKRAQRIRLGVPLVSEKAQETMVATLNRYGPGLATELTQTLAIEYEHAGVYDASVDLTHALSTRRIALVIPMESEVAVTTKGLSGFVQGSEDSGAVMVWSLNYFEEKRDWEFSPSVAVLGRYQANQFIEEKMRLSDRLAIAARRVLRKDRETEHSEPIAVKFQDMIPEIIRQLDANEVRRIAREISMDACWAALGVMTALACPNVVMREPLETLIGDALTPMMDASNGAGEKWIPVDPFHGQIDMDWMGRMSWKQGIGSLA